MDVIHGNAPSAQAGDVGLDFTIEHWVAAMTDGTQMTMVECKTFDNVPAERCSNLKLHVRGRKEPVHVVCDPEAGDRMRLYMERAIKWGPGTPQGTVSMTAVEITNVNHPGFVTRLYIHPVHGPIFSTKTLRL